MPTIDFLQASKPLTKTYSKTGGVITKTPYPFMFEFTSHRETFKTIQQLESLLKSHSALGHCALKGLTARPLVNESRAGSTDTNATTDWLVLDLDGLPEVTTTSAGGTAPITVDLFLSAMGLSDIDYIVQWSASYGIENKKLRAHVFMLLDKSYAAPLLKQWLIQKNHEVPMLNESMGLTKTGNAISWPLDISACQNDKLIYIAPPVLKGIKDPLAGKPRIELVKRGKRHVVMSTQIAATTQNRALTDARIAKLRADAGLPERKKIVYKMHGTTEVMLKPDECIITEMKTERGFTYFNLNGGDSWAYFHPENNPDYIQNFKGEPAYLTKELLPDYWTQLTGTGSSTRTSSNGLLYLAFLDRATGVYWRGTYEAASDVLDLTPAKNETQLRHFAKQYGVPLGDFIPEWDIVFDPDDVVRVDVANRIVNKFQPTQFMLNVGNKMPKAVPKTIMKVMANALGNEPDIIEHFVNWLAAIVQTRDRTRTSWVLHGTQGTGKGILTSNILKPLFGVHTATRRMEELNEKYNHFMEGALIVFVDEVETKALQNERGVMAKLKNFITEPTIALRQMYANAVEVRNRTNWIFMSNKTDPIIIDREDRRTNVAKYQPNKLVITEAEIDQIPKELQSFYDYLANYPVDLAKAGTVIHSEDRDTMISISESSIDTVGNALLDGDFNFFIEQMPTDETYKRNMLQLNKVKDYTDTLENLMKRTTPTGACNITREELRTLFAFTIGNVPESPNKFTSLLKHHRIHLEVVKVDNKAVRGMRVVWTDAAMFGSYRTMHFTAQATPTATKPKSTLAKPKMALATP
jgi:Family of unknown function (DUF5906)